MRKATTLLLSIVLAGCATKSIKSAPEASTAKVGVHLGELDKTLKEFKVNLDESSLNILSARDLSKLSEDRVKLLLESYQ